MSSAPPADPLLEAFWRAGLILFGDRVKQEYALETPIFIDLRRRLYDDLETLEALGVALHRRLTEISGPAKPQQVIGIPDTATPIALATALASRRSPQPIDYGQLRKQPAAYPGGRSGVGAYMGVVDPTREITLLDDVMASGRTKRWAIEQLGMQGLKPVRILVVVDREQGAEVDGCPLFSLYRISALIDYFEQTGRVSGSDAQRARDHIRSRRFR